MKSVNSQTTAKYSVNSVRFIQQQHQPVCHANEVSGNQSKLIGKQPPTILWTHHRVSTVPLVFHPSTVVAIISPAAFLKTGQHQTQRDSVEKKTLSLTRFDRHQGSRWRGVESQLSTMERGHYMDGWPLRARLRARPAVSYTHLTLPTSSYV